jgi:hypothetical protein
VLGSSHIRDKDEGDKKLAQKKRSHYVRIEDGYESIN